MEKCKINIPEGAAEILKCLQENGYEAYVVGGCVRDALLGREAHDWDVTTNALPEQVKKLFRRTIDTGIKHGTVSILKNRVTYEVTTYRIDGTYGDGRHPDEVTYTRDLSEDLRRRDFTINAMAYNDADGLVDLFGGLPDLEQKIIRSVGDAKERFTEDALRIMRCVRFSAQLGFSIEEKTYVAAAELSDRLRFVSAERIREELLKILESDRPDKVELLDNIGAMDSYFVEYRANKETINEKLLRMPKDRILRLTALLNHTGRTTPESYMAAERFLNTLKFDNDTKNAVLHTIRFSETMLTTDRYQLRRFLNACGSENASRILCYMEKDRDMDLSKVKAVVESILADGECTCLKDLAISGKDLIGLGMRPGKEMGELLMALLAEVLRDPSLNQKETLLAKAKERIKN